MSELAQITQLPGTVALRRAATGVLLEAPPKTPPATTDMVYALVGERVGTAPMARYRLPESLRETVIVTEGAYSGDGDQPIRSIVITCTGDRNHAVHHARGVHGGRLCGACEHYH